MMCLLLSSCWAPWPSSQPALTFTTSLWGAEASLPRVWGRQRAGARAELKSAAGGGVRDRFHLGCQRRLQKEVASQRGLEDECLMRVEGKGENIPESEESPGRAGWGSLPAASCPF